MERIRELFAVTPFMQDLGVEIVSIEEGVVETALTVQQRHLQQNGFVHAGVGAAMADHTAGGAAGTLAPEGMGVLTTEYSIHFLRPAKGARMRCRATVLKPGKRLSVVETEIYCDDALVAKMTATMAIVPYP